MAAPGVLGSPEHRLFACHKQHTKALAVYADPTLCAPEGTAEGQAATEARRRGAMSKIALRYVLASLLAWSLGLVLGGPVHALPTLSVFHYTLGAPDGSPPGNPFLPGSATSYVASLTTALGGTLGNRSTFAPQEATVWGPSGTFGGELYFLSLVQELPTGALLEEHKTLVSTLPGQPAQPLFDVTLYVPIEAYHHTPSDRADGFTRLIFASAFGPGPTGTEGSAVDGSLRTFASFGSFAGDVSDAQGFAGTANHPPPAIASFIGTSARYEASYRLIEGDWSLVGATVSGRGFRFGTGFVDLDPTTPLTITALGSVSATSVVGAQIPEPATGVLLGLGLCGLLGARWRSHRAAG